MLTFNMPLEADVKSFLQKLYDCTQTECAKLIGAWVLIIHANDGKQRH